MKTQIVTETHLSGIISCKELNSGIIMKYLGYTPLQARQQFKRYLKTIKNQKL